MPICYAFDLALAFHGGNGWGGIRTPGAFRHTRFPGVHNQPLCHPSKCWILLVLVVVLVNRAWLGDLFGYKDEQEDEDDYELKLQSPK